MTSGVHWETAMFIQTQVCIQLEINSENDVFLQSSETGGDDPYNNAAGFFWKKKLFNTEHDADLNFPLWNKNHLKYHEWLLNLPMKIYQTS